MKEEKEPKTIISGNPAIEKLFTEFESEEDVTIKSIELALKKVEFELKNIRHALKAYRKKNEKIPAQEVLKG